MKQTNALWRMATRWYVVSVAFIALGVVAGYFIFFTALWGKPQVGVIDVPYTIIDEYSASFIGDMLDYAAQQKSIKAVVIKLNSPGGEAAAGEQLFLKTLKLREKKPVVIVVGDIAASSGYMMAMGANYIYAKPASFVGSVGVLLFLYPPSPPDERLLSTGPSKLTGSTERSFTGALEMLKESFLQIVLTQRGDRLKITPQELVEARIYPGMEGVRLGLVDAIGSDTDAIEKAVSLARISHYDLVDVNVEVLRIFVQKLQRIFGSSQVEGVDVKAGDIKRIRRLFPSYLGGSPESKPPGFPIDVTLPQLYHLYVTPSE